MSAQPPPSPVIWIHEAEELEHLRSGLASYNRLGADSHWCWNDEPQRPEHLVPLYDKSVVDSLLKQRDELAQQLKVFVDNGGLVPEYEFDNARKLIAKAQGVV